MPKEVLFEKRYTLNDDDLERLDKNFRYHPPKDDQLPRYTEVRNQQRRVAELIMSFCPPSRERSIALTKLEEVGFWANAAIARNE